MKDQDLVLFLYLQKKLVAYYMQPHTLLVPYHYKKPSCGPTQKGGCIMGPRLLFFNEDNFHDPRQKYQRATNQADISQFGT